MRITIWRMRLLGAGVALVLAALGASAKADGETMRTRVAHLDETLPGSSGVEVQIDTSPHGQAIVSGTPYVVGPIVAPTTTVPEAEEHIAVDPNAYTNLVATISDFSIKRGFQSQNNFNTTKYAFSFDNGSTWTESFIPLDSGKFPITSDGQRWEANSDPVVAIDRAGRVYFSNLYFNSVNNANGLYVGVGALNSASKTLSLAAAQVYPVSANLDPNTNVDEDKEWIAVDNSGGTYDGNVYVSWTRFVGNTDAILFSRSTDHGQTWQRGAGTNFIQISLPSQNGAVQGSQVAVGPHGEVYVVYEVSSGSTLRQHWMAKSLDGGQSFTQPFAITPMFNELKFRASYRINSFAALAISPVDGSIHVAYADQPTRTSGAQVEYVRSTSGGTAFSAPVALNDSIAGEQFMPALTVDQAGAVHVSWFDTRNAANASSYDIYATRSVDDGITFAANARVTPTTINAGTSKFIGDYAGIAAEGGYAHPVWTNGGFNGGKLQTSALH